jgi:uncharacterized protein
MSEIENKVLDYVKERIAWHKETSEDHYDFWEQHIKYVYKEAIKLAKEYDADEEIVRLGALLHDIALINMVGTRQEHNVNGKIIAEEVLTNFDYPKEKMDRVLGCVLHHRSGKEAENIEEICVADADVLAHFDNVALLFDVMYTLRHLELAEVREQIALYIEKDFNDLSPKTREGFKERYEVIKSVIVGEE